MKKQKKYYNSFYLSLNIQKKLIDKVLNQETGQLPRFPVNQTLRKFYKPHTKTPSQDPSKTGGAWKLYSQSFLNV